MIVFASNTAGQMALFDLTWTFSGSFSEAKKSINRFTISIFRVEAVRIELVRILKVFRIAVDGVRVDNNKLAFLKMVVGAGRRKVFRALSC